MSRLPLNPLPEQAIAIVGMAGRFPGADNIEAFWQNLLDGKDSITRFESKPAPESYVAARGVLQDADLFDADYFGITPFDAERMDPQHRIMLEVAEEALAHAGYSSHRYEGEIGIYAGCSLNTYLLQNLATDRRAIEQLTSNYQVGEFATALGNDKDFLTTRIAYKLNLRGPAVTVQAACATSLVAVAQAAQALLNHTCSMALAGGVSITFPQERGHIAQEGSLLSGDGTCRPFDAKASGTVFSHGAGMVVLKRLEDAVADGDTIHSVILGFGITNDGAQKVGYMAPGVDGQARAIRTAQAMAGLSPDAISYIEAHGTGTPLGDPVEFSALSEVFGSSAQKAFCTIGAAKANVGHLDCAAGVTGLIKTALSLKHKVIPGLKHFTTPNPHLQLQDSPFRFTSTNEEWASSTPRRAGVSAFGVGGVNSHIVLEEPPAFSNEDASGKVQPIVLSARTEIALDTMRLRLADVLEKSPELLLDDVAYTLAAGRTALRVRTAFVASSISGLIEALRNNNIAEAGGTPTSDAAAAWISGDESLLNSFFDQNPGKRIPLPGYAFERKRFWIEAPAASASQDASTATASTADTADLRNARIRRQLAEELRKISGVEISPEEESLNFLDLGFDSLFLTTATQTLTKVFGVPVTFRQLMEEDASVATIAAYLDEKMPPDATAPQPTAAVASNDKLGSLLEQQIAALSDVFSSQLAALREVAGLTPAKSKPALALPKQAASVEVKHGAFRNIQKTSHAVDGKQTAYLERLIATYTAKTPTSKQRTADARKALADPRAVAGFRQQWKEMVYPLVTDRAHGSRIIDVDGNEYIDLVNGYGCILFGHSPSFVVEAAQQQIELGVAIGPQSALSGEVAQLIAEATGNERVAFCNTGSEAVMAAIRIARTVTGRDRVVYFTGDYHGTFDEVLVRQTPMGTAPIAPGIPVENMGNITVLDYGTPETLEYLRAHAHELAAMLVEPVQTRHPEVQPFEFLHKLREITTSSDTALIMDEVVTGFRVAPGGFQEYIGIRGDISTYGKVLGGGYPIGVLAGKARFMDALDGGAWQYGDASSPEVGMTFFAGTFVRHPLALAIAKAVLGHLREEGPSLQSMLADKAAALAEDINREFATRSIPYRVHGFSSWFYFSFPSEWKLAPLFYYALRLRGIHIQEGYPCFLTTAHTDADLDTVRAAFREVIDELHKAGVFPGETAPEPEEESPSTVALTEPQREIFLAASLSDEANCAFNESLTLTLDGPVREDALRFALNAAVERHDVLRSTVDESGEMLVFSPVFQGTTEFSDLTNLAPAQQDEKINAHTATEAALPFDLHRGPMVRIHVFRQSADRYTVLVTAHHMVLDGWSANELLREISIIYSQGTRGLESLPKAGRFSRYAQREKQRTDAGEFRENEDYWVKRFEGRTPRLNLPTDEARKAVREFDGATYRGQLGTELLESARAMGKRFGCSLYVVLLSSFQLLLHRLTQQDEVVVGISTAGQALLQDESLIGHCVHFLPMLSDLPAGMTVEQHLRATRSAMLDAQSHQEYTFGSLLQQLRLPRDSSRIPLIEVQFNLEKIGESLHFDRLQATVKPNAKRFVNTDIFLNVMETPQGVELACDYNTGLFHEETIGRWLDIWQKLLQSAVSDTTSEVATLPLLPESQHTLLLETWNSTSRDFGPFESIPAIVAKHAAAKPDKIAAECNGSAWTYRELHQFSTALAQRLVRENIKQGDLVGISIDRSLELLGTMLAVMQTGAAYLPLDSKNPQERINLILADAGVSLLLTGRDPKIISPVRRLDVTVPHAFDHELTLPLLTSDHLAYLLYTSGSTGVPKGVAITQGSLLNLLHSMAVEPGFTANDTMLAVTTVSFDISELELLLPLLTGGRLIIATEEEVRDGMLLLGLLHSSKATVMQATPGLWRLLFDSGWNNDQPLKALCGGEALPADLATQLIDNMTEVWNMYGPTETTIWSSVARVSAGSTRIGGPIANTQFYVLDSKLQPLPIGVPGELYIGGAGLAKGYWNRDDLTSQVFLPNPFGEGRIYRTGDAGRWFGDRTIALAGRLDSQVKVRGYRIELSEVEAAFQAQPQIAAAAVVYHAATDNSPAALSAFIQWKADAVRNLDAVRLAVQSILPEYMLPREIFEIDQMPVTSNGKIDRKALVLSRHHAEPVTRVITPAENATEQQLVRIWSELLDRTDISTTESVFELGIDSLTIFRMAARCQREGLPIRASQILALRTIKALALGLTGSLVETSAAVKASRVQAVSRKKFLLEKNS